MDTPVKGATSPAQGLMLQARFRDLDEFAGALRHDDVELVKLGHSGGLNGVDLVMLPDLLVRIGHQATGWDCLARTPDGALSMVLAWGYQDRARIYGRDFADGSFSLSGPGTEFVSTVSGAGNYLFLPIPVHLLDERMLGAARGDALSAGFKTVGDASPSAFAMLRNTLDQMKRAAERDPVNAVDERLRRNLQNALLTAVHYVIGPALATADQVPRSFLQRTRVIRRAFDQLRSMEAHAMSVMALSRELRMPEPALRILFQEFTGLGPNEFIQRLRLQRMHKALRTGLLSGPDAIRQAALDAGFCDVDRVGMVYRGLHPEAGDAAPRATDLVAA